MIDIERACKVKFKENGDHYEVAIGVGLKVVCKTCCS